MYSSQVSSEIDQVGDKVLSFALDILFELLDFEILLVK